MNGAALTVLKLDDELKELLDYEAKILQELKCKLIKVIDLMKRGAPLYLDERGYTVLKTIVNNPAITGKEVEASLQLSRKQLSYTIER